MRGGYKMPRPLINDMLDILHKLKLADDSIQGDKISNAYQTKRDLQGAIKIIEKHMPF